ncbi:alpha/beta hydrolase [Brachybacterium endophyticum]|uniref:Alpha/beta hydrolase n=1 Tax=Brachybacterium endophyticum TaxID=2182385 RepID=A0A2U2RGS4_9MICO|nr:alpha/beta hydrolase [Brachybacterium endophyticum]PWH05021.1 alpha/beta hydrolase [Brachybacterium endophyticum]
MVTTENRTLALADADIAYTIRGPLPPTGDVPTLLMIGQPMTSEGFTDLAEQFPDRTVVSYDPRGLGASTRRDGSRENDPRVQAEDLHRLISELGGPVDVFGSSGGAVTGLALIAAHPDDVNVLVAHEPPLRNVLPDADLAARADHAVTAAYHDRGWGAGMAAFLGMVTWQGPFTEEFLAAAPPDPSRFGMPAEDDGRREDPLLSGSSRAVSEYQPDVEALRALPTTTSRIVLAVGEGSGDTITARTTRATADLLGSEAVVFPGDHGGFMRGNPLNPGEPEAFARRLREVLDAAA